MSEDKKKLSIPKEKFEFVQRGEKIYDKKFETKPVGYFRDAMSRFGKNRTNMVATAILGFIIACAIFVPIISNKNYTELESQLSHLPPRIPLLENMGIFDGTSKKERQTVDLSTYNEAAGIGDPIGYNPEFVIPGTSTIYSEKCTVKESACVGGENSLMTENNTPNVAIMTPAFNGLNANPALNPRILIDVFFIDENTSVNAYIRYQNPLWIENEEYTEETCPEDEILHLGECYEVLESDVCPAGEFLTEEGGDCTVITDFCEDYELNGQAFNNDECVDITAQTQLVQYTYEFLDSTSEVGLFEMNYVELNGIKFVPLVDIAIIVEVSSPDANKKAVFNSIQVLDNDLSAGVDGEGNPITKDLYKVSGYNMSVFDIVSFDFSYNNGTEDVLVEAGAGAYTRQNGTLLLIDFRYEDYLAAFADKNEPAFAKSKFLEATGDYPDVCIMPDETQGESLFGWEFNEGCPVVRVYSQTESVFVKQVMKDENNVTILPEDLTEELCTEAGFVFREIDEENQCALETFSYDVDIDYAILMGYDEIPFFFFGTTAAGRDLFTLIWVATRTSLLIGVIVASINISVGVVYGSISGYYGGLTDLIMQRFAEVIGRVPWIVTLSIFVSIFGPGILTLIYILIFAGWIGVASITRTQFYRYKGREYVLASRTLGAKDSRLIFRHILPNGIGTIITSSILSIPGVIFAESTISYLGFGIGHGQEFKILGVTFSGVSIGVLLAEARTYLLTKPYLTLFPAIVISILMITFNMFGNALRDAFNPSLRGSE